MRQETLQDLADSIKAQGVVQPIVVRPVGTPEPGQSQRYEIIAGERRWRASQIAGFADIPAIIRHIPDEAAIAVALIENIQREDLNSLEEARALVADGKLEAAAEKFAQAASNPADALDAIAGQKPKSKKIMLTTETITKDTADAYATAHPHLAK